MSEEALRLVCKKELGHSPVEHVTYLKMKSAALRLLLGSIKVSAVAEAFGYSNPFAFSTTFKRWMGLPPLQYRKELTKYT